MNTRTETKPDRRPDPLPVGCESLLSREQLCSALGVSLRKLDSMVSAGQFPRADLRLGSMPRWRVATFNRWVEEQAARSQD